MSWGMEAFVEGKFESKDFLDKKDWINWVFRDEQ